MTQRAHYSLMHAPTCDITIPITQCFVTSQATCADIIVCVTSTLFLHSQSTTVKCESGLNPSMLNALSSINIIYCLHLAVYINNITITRVGEEGINCWKSFFLTLTHWNRLFHRLLDERVAMTKILLGI